MKVKNLITVLLALLVIPAIAIAQPSNLISSDYLSLEIKNAYGSQLRGISAWQVDSTLNVSGRLKKNIASIGKVYVEILDPGGKTLATQTTKYNSAIKRKGARMVKFHSHLIVTPPKGSKVVLKYSRH